MTTLNDLIDAYEVGANMRKVTRSQSLALRPIRRGLGHLQPDKLTPYILAQYTIDRRTKGSYVKQPRPAADGTLRRELGSLITVLNWCVEKRMLKADSVPSIDVPPVPGGREVFLTEAEADALKHRAAELGDCPILRFVWLGLDTGARSSAIETLTWDRVNLAQRTIDYRDPSMHQTKKRRQIVPMSPNLHKLMTAWYGQGATGRVVGDVKLYEWKRFVKTTPWPHLVRHDLRRSCASILVARGIDLLKVAQFIGDNYQTVLKHYARFAPDYLSGIWDTPPAKLITWETVSSSSVLT